MHSKHFDLKEVLLNRRIVQISLVSIVVYALIYFIWGEKLPIAEGLGWDGLTYAAYATNFIQELLKTSDSYHITRIFPSFFIYCVAKILGIKLSTPHTVFVAFYILNNVMFLSAGFLWYKICQLKSFSTTSYLIGFISLFINYSCLKLSQYAPVFVDSWVLFFGMLILYLFLKHKYVLMCMVLFPIYFTWPIAVVLGIPLVIYTFTDKTILNNLPQDKINAAIAVALFIVCISILCSILIGQSVLISNWVSVLYSWNQAWWAPQSHRPFLIYVVVALSLFIACVYIYYIALYSALFKTLKNSYRINFTNAGLYILLIVLCSGVSFWLMHLSVNYTGKSIFSTSEFLALTLLGAVVKPGFNFIMHATFLGPWSILLLIYMRSILRVANEERFGLLLFTIITYFMALNCHSRQLTFNVPFMIYLICRVLNNSIMIKDKTKFLLCYSLAAFLGSKIYYLINVAPMQGDILSYPFQRFFMNFGLWTMWRGYFFNLGLTIIMCLILYFGCYKSVLNVKESM